MLGTWRARLTAALHWAHNVAPRRAGRAQIAQRVKGESPAIEVTVIFVVPSMPPPRASMTLA